MENMSPCSFTLVDLWCVFSCRRFIIIIMVKNDGQISFCDCRYYYGSYILNSSLPQRMITFICSIYCYYSVNAFHKSCMICVQANSSEYLVMDLKLFNV